MGISKQTWWVCLALACSGAPRAPSSIQAAGEGGGAGSNVSAGAGAGGAGQGASGRGNSSGSGGAAGIPAGRSGSAAGAGMEADDAGASDAAAGRGGAPGEDGASVTRPVRSTGPGDWVAGDYPPNLMGPTWLELSGVAGQGSNVRQYKVHIPPSYKPSVPAPLVFCIHGLGQDGLLFCVTGAAMHMESDAAGFVLVMPNGYQNSWNAGTCCGAASTEKLDDVALFRAIFSEVGKHVNIDLDRVYATGLSNGAYMSYRLACQAADIFTAVAPSAGAIGKNDIGGGTNSASDFTTCEPSRPISVLDVHGTQDPLIPHRLQAPSLAHITQKNGCGTTTTPALQPKSGGDTSCVTYEGCPAGIEVTSCSIQGGGHCWFGSPDCGTGGGPIGLAIVGANSDTLKNTSAAWQFFERLSR
jgi:polyhydroxybutyrate depolymerase